MLADDSAAARGRQGGTIRKARERRAGAPTLDVRLAPGDKAGMLGAVTRALCRLALALAFAGAACLPAGELVAIDGSHRMVARDPQTGISIVLTTGAWQGIPSDLDESLTVIHVLVANLSDKTIRLAPGDLEMVDERGFRRQLLDAGGSFVQAGQSDGGYHPGRNLDFERVDKRGNAATLTWHFHDAEGRPVVDMSFDLYVARTGR